ncbi:APC family permease [uncultured Phenylobacterium sp.]|uniref:APC family permease n=1 Tax=uncultured Phenylobacterium sp. TaxID=349273 RepID=UPI0025DD939E|nr:APC family permease [uncultured Phenylobacterium sp.]
MSGAAPPSADSEVGPQLNRTIGTAQLMLYGVGSMLGAGIYGLVGKAAGVMGGAVWMAFLVAMAAALLTGVSYASIASRYPKAGGAAYVAQRAYRTSWLSYVIGLAIVCSGLASIATQAKVVAENLNTLIGLDFGMTIAGPSAEVTILAIGFLLLVASIVYRGITESLWANAICTIVEALGLLLVIAVGMRFWGQADLLAVPTGPANPAGALTVGLLLQGSILTFFSFLGFEDMLNVAEEVKRPERTIPVALIGAMILASLIYMAVSITAVSVVPWPDLAAAPGPLKLVIERAAPWFPAVGFTVITIAAVANTALVNYVMGSRLLYGMARQGLLPAVLGRVHGARRTPHVAIGALLAIVVALQFAGGIEQLASATVLLLLVVFVLVNGALIVLTRREGKIEGCFNAPILVPAAGGAICLVMIVGRVLQDDWRGPAIAGVLIAAILVLYVVTRPGRRSANSRT